MKIVMPEKKKLFDIGLVLLGIVIIAYIYNPLRNIINPFIYALVLAYLLNPAVKLLEKNKVNRIWAILIVFVLLFFLFSIAFATLIPRLTRDLRVFIDEIPNILKFIEKIVGELQSGQIPFIPEGVQDFLNLDEQIKNIGEVLRGS